VAHPYHFVVPANGRLNAVKFRVSAHPLETFREDASEACPLPIDHVRHVASLAQAALLKKFGKSDACDFFAEDNRPIVGTELGQRLGQSKGFHTRPDRA
jgi:hypothetical protein